MSAELIVRPGHTEASRDAFINSHSPFSVALDGYVKAPPFFQPNPGPYQNFDHHYGVERLATLSTSQQVLRAIRQGFVEAFSSGDDYRPVVYVNDCDQDVALACYLLMHGPDIAAQKTIKRGSPLRSLVDVAGDLDVTAGAYPYPLTMKAMREVAWMFRPFTEQRNAGLTRNAEEFRSVIGQCCGRIGLYLAGRGEEVKLETAYKTLGKGEGWQLFKEIGTEGRIGAFRNKVHAFMIFKGERADSKGVFDYSIGRISEYIDFDVKTIVAYLNEAEGLLDSADKWGCDGSGIIGGSPRERGSRLDPDTLFRLVNDLVRTHRRS